jgi:hypothetical protein
MFLPYDIFYFVTGNSNFVHLPLRRMLTLRSASRHLSSGLLYGLYFYSAFYKLVAKISSNTLTGISPSCKTENCISFFAGRKKWKKQNKTITGINTAAY